MYELSARLLQQLFRQWDNSPHWRDGQRLWVCLLGATAMPFYIPDALPRRETEDVDAAVIRTEDMAAGRAEQQAAAFGVSFRAGPVAWLAVGWEDRIAWLDWPLSHLQVGVPDPYDWILSKLGRWMRHDQSDAVAVVQHLHLDPARLAQRVRDGLPDYIGDPRRIRWAWEDLADQVGWAPQWRTAPFSVSGS